MLSKKSILSKYSSDMSTTSVRFLILKKPEIT